MVKTELLVSALLKEKHGLCEGRLLEEGGRVCRRGVGCFLGALLYHAGYRPSRIRALEDSLRVPLLGYGDVREDTDSKEYRARARLQEFYGLNDDLIDDGRGENDNFSDLTSRWDQETGDEYPNHYERTRLARRDHMIEWVKNLK